MKGLGWLLLAGLGIFALSRRGIAVAAAPVAAVPPAKAIPETSVRRTEAAAIIESRKEVVLVVPVVPPSFVVVSAQQKVVAPEGKAGPRFGIGDRIKSTSPGQVFIGTIIELNWSQSFGSWMYTVHVENITTSGQRSFILESDAARA